MNALLRQLTAEDVRTASFDRSREAGAEDSFNPRPSFFRCLEQGWVTNAAPAEAGFQVPQPLVLRFMVCRIEADDHAGKLVICEDKVAVSIVAVDEHAHRHK